MTLVVPNASEGTMLEYILNKTAPTDLVLRLFKNNITPAEADVLATYTEADFGGYAGIALAGVDWTITPGAPTEAVAAQQTYTASGASLPQLVYGYYVTRSGVGGLLMWAERFTTGPFNLQTAGDQIKVTPKFTGE